MTLPFISLCKIITESKQNTKRCFSGTDIRTYFFHIIGRYYCAVHTEVELVLKHFSHILVNGALSLPNDKIFGLPKLNAFADDKINVPENLKFWSGKGRKHCGKRRKCWLPAFSPFPFPTMFSKGFLYRAVTGHDCVVKT